MDTNNWRPTTGQGTVGGIGGGGGAGEPTMDAGVWRTELQPEARQRIVSKIMDTLKRHLPVSGQEGLQELRKIAIRFEEKIFTAATSQGDYLRKISLKMLTMETKSQNPPANSLPPNSTGNGNKPPDPGMSGMQSQLHNQGQPLPIPLSANPSQSRQLLSQNIQNSVSSAGVQATPTLSSALPPASGINQTSIPNAVGQNTNVQNISGTSQNSLGNSMGQGIPSNMFANNPRQMHGRQQVVPQQQQQQQQQSQNLQHIYRQQLQQHLLKQKFQQQQQNLLQTNQMQSPQQSVMQTSSVMQPSLSGLQQNQQPSIQQATHSMLQQHRDSVLRQQQQPQQAAVVHPQQAPMQHQLQQPNAANMQQNQLIAQQSGVGDMQQQQRLLSQQNNLQTMQQQQQQQQQLMAQQNNFSSMNQQQLGSQSNVSGLQQQQQQLLGAQSVNSSMQTRQHAVHMLQQSKIPVQQQPQQSTSSLLATQVQPSQSQPQHPQQQLMSQIQSQPSQLQQQLGMQQQPNSLQRDMQQRLQASGQSSSTLLQPQNVIDQQKQLYQRAVPDTSSTSLDSTSQTGNANGGDWQEVYQKHDSLPQQPKSEQLERFKMFKAMLERLMAFLQVSKSNILPNCKENLASYEKQILNFVNANRPRKPVSSLQQGQLPLSHMHSMQQPQPQVTQMQPHESQMNPQLQSMSLQGSVATMQQNNMTSLQHNSMSSLSGFSTTQQNLMNSLQPGTNLDLGQGNTMSQVQPVAMGSLQQNPVTSSQQANVSTLSSQSGLKGLQPNINPLQSNSNILQQQHLKQQQEQQMLQTQQLKQQIQQRQMLQQQLMQKQQIMQQQQLHQQPKQQLSAQLQTHQISQIHQINDVNDLKMREGLGVKPGVFQQHLSAGQRAAYSHQQLKSGGSFPMSSLQVASPQILQHSSPQIDQQNVLSSLTKTGTPLQSASWPIVVPSPSTPLAPSPMPGDAEKPTSGVSSHSNLWNGTSKSIRLTKVPFLDKVIEDVNKHHSGRWSVKVGNAFKLYVVGSWQFLALLAVIFFLLLMILQAF